MIQLQDFAIRRGGRLLFDQATMQLHPGWKIGLTGVNGAGKSTLFSAFLGEITGDAGKLSRPSVWTVAHMAQEVETQETAAVDFVLSGDEEWWSINQALELDDPEMPIETLTDLHGRFGEIDGYTAPARAAQMMAGLGFSDAQLSLPVSSFSGGWRMRLNLARTLMSRSDLLLLDEPTNHLDLDAILWLEDWLKQYPGTLVLISHDRDFLDAITDHILHVENQKLTLYTGNYSTFEQTRGERLAQQQQAFEKQQATRAHLQKYIDRFKAQATKARQAQSRIKQLERMQELSAAHVDTPFTFSFREPTSMSTPLLRLDEVNAGYAADKVIVNNIVLQLTPDSRIGLLGMNGAGKSTLIKTLTGVLPTLSGEREASEHLNLGYFAQHQMDELDGDASPMLAISRLAGRQVSDVDLRAFLGSFGFSGQRMDEPCAGFSGGERARLALALIVWKKPNVLILDEPTNHLDLDMRLALSMALQDFEVAVVLVSHERQLIAAVCDELFVVHDGSCQPFAGDLSDYADWLRQARQEIDQKARQAKLEAKQQKTDAPKATTKAAPEASKPVAAPLVTIESKTPADKEQARKQSAAKREQTRPLRKQIEQLETNNQTIAKQLRQIEQDLTDQGLYDAGRKADLLKLMEQQTNLKLQHAQQEEQLFDLMLALETAETE
ncbi:MAG: ribosomal protection-like ABC-F family protein [Flavobacteriales bacterium]